MMTRKQLKAALLRAETAIVNWCDKYREELCKLFMYDERGRRYVSLYDLYMKHTGNHYDYKIRATVDEGTTISSYIGDEELYEEEESPRRKYRVARRAIARLRKIENKIAEWDARNCVLEVAIDEYESSYGLGDDIVAELERFGYKVR